MNKKRIETWRIVSAVASIALIVCMWAQKDAVSVYSSLPREQAIPLIVTTIAVAVAKTAAITVAVLLARWLVVKFKKGA